MKRRYSDPELRALVLDWLQRHERWGSHHYPIDTLVNKLAHAVKDQERLRKTVKELVREGYTLTDKDGNTVSLNPTKNKEIAEYKGATEALRQSERRFRNALDNMLEGCQIIGYDWRYLYVNDAVAKHGRTTKKKLLGKTMMEMYPGIEKTKMFSTLRRCMEERKHAHMENEFEFPDGEKGWFELRIQPVPEGLFVLSIDITERKRAEAERLKMMGDVARSVGHDLRNPLQSIRTATEILGDADEEERHRLLDTIKRNTVYADRIIRNLSDLATFQSSDLSLGDVNLLLQEALTSLILPAKVKLITHYGDIPKSKVDRNQLTRVFTNLILNAVQSMPEDGELDISTGKTGKYIKISIRDTGAGIPKEDVKKIFEPFYTTKAQGTGLGLATAKKMIESHGGTINIQSEKGKGTTVKIRIPITENKP